jgi:hypothetical protein
MNLAEAAMADDAAIWAADNKIKLGGEVFTFTNHEYQLEPLSEQYKRTCDMKATQGGFTELFVLKSLHGMIHGRYKKGVLYLFPTNDDVNDFSKSRFQPLISSNRNAIGKYVKSTDTAALKKIHNAFLYLRGARLSQIVKDEHKESSKLRSIPTDCNIFDEYDLMDEDVREKAFGRMGHSLVQEEHFLSNPTVPDYGISKLFYEESDQRHWFRRCGCGEWTSAEMSFPECVKIRKDGTGYIGCNKCGKELKIFPGIGMGEWVAACPDKSSNMVGRRWSQLTSIFHDPADILEAFVNPREGNLGDVYRLKLGLPYIAAEDRLRQSEVLSCCGGKIEMIKHSGPCAMGVDVGKKKHVIIGARTGKDRYEIYKRTILSDWDDIHRLADRMGVKSAVIDIRPYEDSARDFQAKAKYKVWLCEYKETTPQGTNYNTHTGIVSVNRTEICDATHRLVTTPGMLTLPMLTDNMKEYAKQMCASYKVLEENKKTKVSVYRYKNAGPDHDRHATNYFLLAASGGKVATITQGRRRKAKRANNDYARI